MPRGRGGRPRETEPLPLQRRTGPDGAEAGVRGTGRARQGRSAAFVGSATQRLGPQYPHTMNPMRNIKLIVDGSRLWSAIGFAVRMTTLWLALVCGFSVGAQEPDASAQTNDMTAAEVLSQLNAMVQTADGAQAEDRAPSNEPAATNGLPQASAPASGGDRPNRFIRPDNSTPSPGSSRPQSNDRRSRGRRSSNSRPGQPAGYGSARDYSSGSDHTQANAATGTNNGLVSL